SQPRSSRCPAGTSSRAGPRSRSSTRRSRRPPAPRADSHAAPNASALPRWRLPDGVGARRPTGRIGPLWPYIVAMLPFGAQLVSGGVRFRVWAPRRKHVEVAIDGGGTHALAAVAGARLAGTVAKAGDGTRYRYRLDGGLPLVPDPASRFQPDGPHGPSQVVDPARYRWNDAGWRGLGRGRHAIYELHLGTFTPEGTWA